MQPATNSQQALSQIQSFDASRSNPSDVLNQAQNKYGVGQTQQRLVGLRSAIMGTENLLNNVDPSVTGRTANSLVTEAQRSKMVANERAPIADQYSQQQGALANENANLNDASTKAAQEAQLTLTGQDTKRNALQSLYDTLYKREQDKIAQDAAAKAASSSAFDMSKYLGSSGGGNATSNGTSTNNGVSPLSAIEQQGLANATGFVNKYKGNDNALISDFKATLSSANRGNAVDKAKLQAYATLRPDLFGNGGSYGKLPAGTYSNKPGQQMLTYAKSQFNPFNSNAYTNALYLPAQATKGLYNTIKKWF